MIDSISLYSKSLLTVTVRDRIGSETKSGIASLLWDSFAFERLCSHQNLIRQ